LLAWLSRDARPLEKELLVDFAIRQHLALLPVLVGLRPWWAVAAAARWAAARGTLLAMHPRTSPGPRREAGREEEEDADLI
jgi:hypothetical protein